MSGGSLIVFTDRETLIPRSESATTIQNLRERRGFKLDRRERWCFRLTTVNQAQV